MHRKPEDMQDMLERMIEQKAQLEARLEEMAVDLETSKLELELVREEQEQQRLREEEEKRKLEAELTLDNTPAASVYREKIAQLKNALEKVTTLYEAEKNKTRAQALEIEGLQNKEKELSDKLKDMDILFEAVDSREKIIEELKLRLDEAHGYEKMVEKLTEESLLKDEEIEKMIRKYKEKIEELKTEEEINELIEEEKKELNLQLASKETELANQKNVQLALEGRIGEFELEIKRYQDKITRYKEEIGLLEGQIRNSGQEEKLKKIEELVAKQNRLSVMLREARKFEINSLISQHSLTMAQLKLSLCLAVIPAKLNELVNIPGYEKVALLYTCRGKCDTVLHLLKEKYLIDDEGTEVILPFVSYISELLIKMTTVTVYINKLLYYLTKCTPEQYDKITKDQTKWNHILVVNSFIGQIMELIKDELLSPQVSLDSFRVSVNEVVEFVNDLKVTALSGGSTDTHAKADAEPSDKFLAEHCLLRIDIPVSVLYYIYTRNHEGTSLQIEKASKIHKNIRKTMGLLRKVRASEDGSRYLRHWQMMEESFEQKFKYGECLWTKGKEAYESNDWTSWLEAIDAQLLGMYGHANFKELEAEGIEEKVNDVSGYGPWSVKTKEVNKELSEAAELKQEIEQLNESLKNEKLEYLKLDKEFNEIKIIKGSLERRLGESQQKIERIGQLEIEKKRFLEKEKIYHDSIENLRLECDQHIQKNKDLNEKISTLETQLAESANITTKTRKGSSMRQQDLRRGSIRVPGEVGLGKSMFSVQGGNYYQQIIRKLIVFHTFDHKIIGGEIKTERSNDKGKNIKTKRSKY
eukprot:TRINITY_DN1434_c0_g3_i1.p1 TRINITY_DN1434_c0_g3~~TRINITY_DN1434_c0_g3_i1.p1  ORF type:complete len:812 (-),score=175.58 TRINITY_DN1434_c0_g3_i1:559-2994(-)